MTTEWDGVCGSGRQFVSRGEVILKTWIMKKRAGRLKVVSQTPVAMPQGRGVRGTDSEVGDDGAK